MRGYLRGKAQRIFNILSSELSGGEWAKLLSFRFALQRESFATMLPWGSDTQA